MPRADADRRVAGATQVRRVLALTAPSPPFRVCLGLSLLAHAILTLNWVSMITPPRTEPWAAAEGKPRPAELEVSIPDPENRDRAAVSAAQQTSRSAPPTASKASLTWIELRVRTPAPVTVHDPEVAPSRVKSPAVRGQAAEPFPAPVLETAPPEAVPRIVLREDFTAQPSTLDAALAEDFQILELVRPVYPPEAVEAEVEGLLRMEVRVNLSGRVEDVHILESPGHPALEGASLNAIYRWQFRPYTLAGRPIPFTVVVPFRFRIER